MNLKKDYRKLLETMNNYYFYCNLSVYWTTIIFLKNLTMTEFV